MAGFDCSGYVIEVLKSVGILPRKGDWTAQGLWARFKEYPVDIPYEGCLVFWKERQSSRAIHIEICLNDELAIGAGGGGSTTQKVQDAIDQNAYIKVRPFRSRGNIKGFLDPFKSKS